MEELFPPVPPPCLPDFPSWAAGGPLVGGASCTVWLLGQCWRWAMNHSEFLGLLQPWCCFRNGPALSVVVPPCCQRSVLGAPLKGTVQKRPCGQSCFLVRWMLLRGRHPGGHACSGPWPPLPRARMSLKVWKSRSPPGFWPLSSGQADCRGPWGGDRVHPSWTC